MHLLSLSTVEVCVVDDDLLLLREIESLINSQQDFFCSIAASSLGEFFESIRPDSKPDLLLLDLRLGAVVSIGHIHRIRSLFPEIKIILVTGSNEADVFEEALKAGLDGLFIKEAGAMELLNSMRLVLKGEGYIAPRAASMALRMLDDRNSMVEERIELEQIKQKIPDRVITTREAEIIQLLIEGKSYQDIAAVVYISIDGVRYYVKKLYKSLNITNRHDLKSYLRDATV